MPSKRMRTPNGDVMWLPVGPEYQQNLDESGGIYQKTAYGWKRWNGRDWVDSDPVDQSGQSVAFSDPDEYATYQYSATPYGDDRWAKYNPGQELWESVDVTASSSQAPAGGGGLDVGQYADRWTEGATQGQELTQEEMLEEQWALYNEVFYPLEQQMLAEARAPIDVDYRQQKAAQDLAKSNQRSDEQFARGLSRIGVDPQAEQMAEIERQQQAIRQAALAGAQTDIAQQAPEEEMQKMGQMSRIGQGLPAQAIQTAGSAQAAGGQMDAAKAQAYGQMAQAGIQGVGMLNNMLGSQPAPSSGGLSMAPPSGGFFSPGVYNTAGMNAPTFSGGWSYGTTPSSLQLGMGTPQVSGSFFNDTAPSSLQLGF